MYVIQDDYLDCFGDPAFTGKVGTDIEDNKCSWLIVQALARASKDQRAILEVIIISHLFCFTARPHCSQCRVLY